MPAIRRRDHPHRDGDSDGHLPDIPAWALEVADLWGMCGLSAQIDGATPGYLTLTPGELVPELMLPGWAGRTTKHLSREAGVILGLEVCAAYRGEHIGASLVRAAAAQLVRRQVGLIEVVAVSGRPVRLVPGQAASADGDAIDGAGPGEERQPSMMLLPVGFWLAAGFRIVRPHPVAPTLRLDLAGTERWLPDFAGAWQRFAELLSQPVPPRPASFSDTHPLQRVDEPLSH